MIISAMKTPKPKIAHIKQAMQQTHPIVSVLRGKNLFMVTYYLMVDNLIRDKYINNTVYIL